jgi:hypothetical protein
VLSRYAPQRKIRAVKNLLTAANDTAPQSEAPEDVTETPIISYYHPNLTIAVCNEPNFVLSYAALPAPLARCASCDFFRSRPKTRRRHFAVRGAAGQIGPEQADVLPVRRFPAPLVN